MKNTSKFRFNPWHFMPFIVLLFFSSCVSMSTMQTGRTIGKGNSELNIGGSAVKLEAFVDTDSTTLNGGVLEGDFRYGVTDKFDVGMKVALVGTSGIYGKYQLVGSDESKFALSAGLGGGYLLGLTDTLGPARGAAGFWIAAVASLSLAGTGVTGYFLRVSRQTMPTPEATSR